MKLRLNFKKRLTEWSLNTKKNINNKGDLVQTKLWISNNDTIIGGACLGNVLKIPEGIKIIYADAFASETIKKVIFPSSLKNLKRYAFGSCRNLESIELPNNVTSIGIECFSYCTNLRYAILSDKIQILNSKIFLNCSSLKEIKLPVNLVSIKERALAYCNALEKIMIPHKVTSIDYGAFKFDTSLKEIYWPKNLKYIDELAFNGCNNITDIYFEGSATEWDNIIRYSNFFINNSIEKARMHFNVSY